MSNDSATGGYLAPAETGPAPAQDSTFEDQLQAIIVGITSLAGDMVRPRWQPRPPVQPKPNEDWCAVGITDVQSEGMPVVQHVGRAYNENGVEVPYDGHDDLQEHERITLLCSFYGPGCNGNAALLRDGLYIAQNREVMRAQGMGLLDVGRVVSLPEQVNMGWIRRVDLEFRVRRQVDRRYPVLNILSAQGAIVADTHAPAPSQGWDSQNAQ
jgi:hypothetical protein